MELETSVVCVSQKDNSVVVANDFSSVHTGANFLFVRKLPKITFPLKISFSKADFSQKSVFQNRTLAVNQFFKFGI